MKAVRKWQGPATLASLLALGVGAVALTPGASAAAPVHVCGSKTVIVEQQGEAGSAPTKFKLSVKAIKSQGVSCTDAYRFLTKLYNNHSTKAPESYTCKVAHFTVPVGHVPEICSKSGKKIQFAGEGG
jgi:hypothetical protein